MKKVKAKRKRKRKSQQTRLLSRPLLASRRNPNGRTYRMKGNNMRHAKRGSTGKEMLCINPELTVVRMEKMFVTLQEAICVSLIWI